MSGLAGRVFLVTGASSGIGRALVLALLARGAQVTAMARTRTALDQLTTLCRHPEALQVLPGDVTDSQQCEGAVAATLTRFGRLDGLIHSAGVSMRGTLEDTELSVHRRLMEVNYFAAVNLIRAALPSLRASRGHIAVVSSLQGKFGMPLRAAYAASKHAVHGMLDSLRIEERDTGVHVMTVCPGYVRTNLSQNALDADGRRHTRLDDEIARGQDPAVVAREILEGLRLRQREIYPATTVDRLALRLSRVAPQLLDNLLYRRARKVADAPEGLSEPEEAPAGI